uniref:Putative salivary lipocalin n=1 Tax=Amblyomma americanum TaxID=6943 RepID=A0A0C9SFD1_AMBAM
MRNMLFTFLLGFCLLAAANSKPKDVPYEDDPQHFNEQKFSTMKQMEGQYFVKKWSYTNTSFRCHSARRLDETGGTEDGDVKYELKARNSTNNYVSYKTKISPRTTNGHTESNAAKYKISRFDKRRTWKIMTANLTEECLVLVTTFENKTKACQLLISKKKAESQIRTPCEDVYDKNCKEKSYQLYQIGCE